MARIPKFPMPHTAMNAVIFAAFAGIGIYGGMKFFQKPEKTPVYMSASARAYAAESNPNHIASRLIGIIASSAVSQSQVYDNMDRIVGRVSQEAPRLAVLANERKTGQITPSVFRAKLKEIAREVATSLGISLVGGDVNMGWGVQQNLFKRLAKRRR
jgi:hypothetical protein